jgi:hypothetical protein
MTAPTMIATPKTPLATFIGTRPLVNAFGGDGYGPHEISCPTENSHEERIHASRGPRHRISTLTPSLHNACLILTGLDGRHSRGPAPGVPGRATTSPRPSAPITLALSDDEKPYDLTSPFAPPPCAGRASHMTTVVDLVLTLHLEHSHHFQQVAVRIFAVEAPPAPAGVELAVGVGVWSTAVGRPLTYTRPKIASNSTSLTRKA